MAKTAMRPWPVISAWLLVLSATAAVAQERSGEWYWDEHPGLALGALRLEFAGRVEWDTRLATRSVGRDRSEHDWIPPRAEVRGRLYRRVRFEISRDFGDDGGDWKDAYLNFEFARWLQVDGGRFKIPFGRETLVSRSHLDFIHRSLGATQLTPGRDTGVMLHGRVWRRRVAYAAGYFDGDGDNARSSEADGGARTYAVRLTAVALTRSDGDNPLLTLGAAFTATDITDRLGLRGRTVLDDGIFFDRAVVNGRRQRTGVEARWVAGRGSLSGEYMRVSDERAAMGFHGEDLAPIVAIAWNVAGTWTVTGEHKSRRVDPKHPLFGGGAGAVEIAARVEELRFDDVEHPGTPFDFPRPASYTANADRVLTLGLNWYVTRHLRVQHNIVVESVSDPGRSPAPTRNGRFTTALLRLQVTL